MYQRRKMMSKKFVIRASEVIEYVGFYEADNMAEAKGMFSRQVSEVTWNSHKDVEVEYNGFQWDICEEVKDGE